MKSRLINTAKIYRKDGILYAHVEDSSYDTDEQDSTSVEVLMPPGLTIDYDAEQDVSVQGWYGSWNGKKFFMMNMFAPCPLENINGTILYHLQDPMVNIQLSENKVHIQAAEDTEIILEKEEPMVIKTNGVSLHEVLSGLVTEIKNLQTFGSPANHKVSPDSIAKLDLLQQNKIDKLLKEL